MKPPICVILNRQEAADVVASLVAMLAGVALRNQCRGDTASIYLPNGDRIVIGITNGPLQTPTSERAQQPKRAKKG